MADDNGASVPSEKWHLDKRVPITIVGAIFLQSVALGWGASSFNSRLENLESRALAARSALEKDLVERYALHLRQRDRITKGEVSTAEVKGALSGLASSMKSVETNIGRIFLILDAQYKNPPNK